MDRVQGHLKTLQDGLKKDGKTDVFPLLLGSRKGRPTQSPVPAAAGQGRQIFDGVKPTFDGPAMVEPAEMMPDLIYGKNS